MEKKRILLSIFLIGIIIPQTTFSQSNQENPRGLYKMTRLIGKRGEIPAPFDQYKYITDSITLTLFVNKEGILSVSNNDVILNYTGEYHKDQDDKSPLIFNSNSEHFSLKWWSSYYEHFCFPKNDWCTEYYEANKMSDVAKPHIEALLASGRLDTLNQRNFPFGSLFNFEVKPKTIALIIGNGDYENLRSLNSPVLDATDMGIMLRDLQFDEVRVFRNTNAKELKEAVDLFTTAAKDYQIALFYFSGHGLQKDGENFLLPIDFKGEKPSELFDCARPQYILADLDNAGCSLKIFILDACRENQLSLNKIVKEKGLAQIEGSKGSFIVYATSENNVALDGKPGSNSIFTSALLKALNITDLNLHEVFDEVGMEVNEVTKGKQIPKVYYQPPLGRFIFNDYKWGR